MNLGQMGLTKRTTRPQSRGGIPGLSLALFLLAGCATLPSPQDGKLKRASDKASTPSAPSNNSHRSHSASSRWGDDDDSWASLCGEVAWYVAGIPWWGPHLALEGDSDLAFGYYLRHPYQVADQPLIYPVRSLPEVNARSSWHLRFMAEYGTDFDGIDRLGTSLRLETAFRLGLDASWSHYREELAAGTTDQLDLGDVNLVYRFVQADAVEMRSGLGLNWLRDGDVSELGFNFTYAGDIYPANPLVVSFEIDWGRIGSASRFHGRTTLGAELLGVELLAGFDYESVDSVGLGSWIAGGRVWF